MENKPVIVQIVTGNNNTTSIDYSQEARRKECLKCSEDQLKTFVKIIESLTNKELK